MIIIVIIVILAYIYTCARISTDNEPARATPATTTVNDNTPGLRYKIPVFSDPDTWKILAATYEQIGS